MLLLVNFFPPGNNSLPVIHQRPRMMTTLPMQSKSAIYSIHLVPKFTDREVFLHTLNSSHKLKGTLSSY